MMRSLITKEIVFIPSFAVIESDNGSKQKICDGNGFARCVKGVVYFLLHAVCCLHRHWNLENTSQFY